MSDEPRNHEDGRQMEGPLGTPMDRRQFLKAAGLTGAAIGVASAFGGVASADVRAAAPVARVAADVSGDCVAVLGLGAGPVFYPDRNNSGFALFHNG
ncbi:MAG: twin-arginine translocation signal domain-containing protein, partial [Armatimonadota bacterium]